MDTNEFFLSSPLDYQSNKMATSQVITTTIHDLIVKQSRTRAAAIQRIHELTDESVDEQTSIDALLTLVEDGYSELQDGDILHIQRENGSNLLSTYWLKGEAVAISRLGWSCTRMPRNLKAFEDFLPGQWGDKWEATRFSPFDIAWNRIRLQPRLLKSLGYCILQHNITKAIKVHLEPIKTREAWLHVQPIPLPDTATRYLIIGWSNCRSKDEVIDFIQTQDYFHVLSDSHLFDDHLQKNEGVSINTLLQDIARIFEDTDPFLEQRCIVFESDHGDSSFANDTRDILKE